MEHITPPQSYQRLKDIGHIDDELAQHYWNDTLWLDLMTVEEYTEYPSQDLPLCHEAPGSVIMFAVTAGGEAICWNTRNEINGDYEVCELGPHWYQQLAPTFSLYLIREFILFIKKSSNRGEIQEQDLLDHAKILKEVLDDSHYKWVEYILSGSKEEDHLIEILKELLPTHYHYPFR